VRVDRMGHDRCTEDRRGQEDRVGALEARHEACDRSAGLRRSEEDAGGEPDGDDEQERDDDALEGARPAAGLHGQHDHRNDTRDHAARQQGEAEQEVQRNRAADDFGQVGGHRHQLGLQPVEAPRDRAPHPDPEDLRQARARDDPELRREVLDQPGHHVAGDDHPDEQVAVAGAGRHVAGDVAGVQVGDAGDEGRAQQPEQAGGRHRRDLRRRGRRSIRFRHAERLAKI
jgi:hypothetical protein